jgi:Flp pilus assembly protein TadG
MNLFENNRGAAAVEFALVALPVIVFILGIMQTAWIVWADNLLHISVNTAARCTAVNSSTPPCNGNTLPQMKATAATVFGPLSGAKFQNNGPCATNQGAGLHGEYDVSFLFVVNLTLTADSCYPTVIVPPEPS